jgi:hypothetical protein
MKRIFTVLAVAALMAALMVASALPVFASEGAFVGKNPGETEPPEVVLAPERGSFVFEPGAQETCVEHFGGSPQSQGQGPPRNTGPGC